MSLTLRRGHVVVDELGMDPLRDRSFDAIHRVQSWRPYTVTDSDKYNAPLIAYNVYENTELWWAILAYNGIPDAFALKPGTRLRIPDINQLMSALADVSASSKNVLVEL